MAKISQQTQNNSTDHQNTTATNVAKSSSKMKGTRKSVPRDSPPQRSSVYRGVTR